MHCTGDHVDVRLNLPVSEKSAVHFESDVDSMTHQNGNVWIISLLEFQSSNFVSSNFSGFRVTEIPVLD
jgi:hypothetical protein